MKVNPQVEAETARYIDSLGAANLAKVLAPRRERKLELREFSHLCRPFHRAT